MHRAYLSKRRFLAGRQCTLRMWNQFHRKDEAKAVTGFQSVLHRGGIEVEELARQRYPGGIEIPRRGITSKEAELETLEVMTAHDTQAIFNGAFSFQDTFVRTDILEKTSEGSWNLLEVKSTTRVRQNHLMDLALQLWILRSLGIDIDQAGLLTVNKNYEFKNEPVDLKAIFTYSNYTNELDDLMAEAEHSAAAFSKILNEQEPPTVRVGPHCMRPFACEFYDLCHTEPVEQLLYPIGLIPQLSGHLRERYEKAGITDVRELKDDRSLNPIQKRALRCIKNGQPEGSNHLASELSRCQYPVHHIDFESFTSAIPIYPNSHPYDSIPFQWSNHIEHEDGSIDHQKFLWEHKSDPREAFTKSLLESLGDTGTICIYSNYEEVEITQMSKLFPHLRQRLMPLLKRTWDLMDLLKKHFYHPGFQGSFSIKKVLPALAPDLGYEGLDISDGKAAMHEYLRSLNLESEQERKEIYEQLHIYCAMDTRALIEIRHFLGNWVKNQPNA